MSKPNSAREMIQQLPQRHKKGALPEWSAIIHMQLKGDGGGEFTVFVHQETVQVADGLQGTPNLVLKGDAKTYVGIELGSTNPQMAFFMGKVSVSSMSEMANLAKAFYRVHELG
jgi:putative sterol carrier protein